MQKSSHPAPVSTANRPSRSRIPFRLLHNAVTDLAVRPRGNVPALDVLRSLAILLVFSGHFAPEFGAPAWVKGSPVVYFGWTGVDLFFVLSGLLIGIQLWKELNKRGHIDVPGFWLRRGLRIWPLYYCFVALIVFEGLFFHRPLGGLWADSTFLSNYFHNQVGGGWSLSTEEQFYIFIPIALLLLSRIVPLRCMWAFPITVLLGLPLGRLLIVQVYGAAVARQRMYFPIHTHSDGLAVGILLAWTAVLYPQFLTSEVSRKIAAPVAAVLGVALYLWNPVVFNYTSLALFYGALTLYGLTIRQPSGFLHWHGFYIISRLSYGIYLNHFGLLPRIVPSLDSLHRLGIVGFFAAYLLSFGGCAIFAFGTFVLVERPFLDIREKWLASRAKPKQRAMPSHVRTSEEVSAP